MPYYPLQTFPFAKKGAGDYLAPLVQGYMHQKQTNIENAIKLAQFQRELAAQQETARHNVAMEGEPKISGSNVYHPGQGGAPGQWGAPAPATPQQQMANFLTAAADAQKGTPQGQPVDMGMLAKTFGVTPPEGAQWPGLMGSQPLVPTKEEGMLPAAQAVGKTTPPLMNAETAGRRADTYAERTQAQTAQGALRLEQQKYRDQQAKEKATADRAANAGKTHDAKVKNYNANVAAIENIITRIKKGRKWEALAPSEQNKINQLHTQQEGMYRAYFGEAPPGQGGAGVRTVATPTAADPMGLGL